MRIAFSKLGALQNSGPPQWRGLRWPSDGPACGCTFICCVTCFYDYLFIYFEKTSRVKRKSNFSVHEKKLLMNLIQPYNYYPVVRKIKKYKEVKKSCGMKYVGNLTVMIKSQYVAQTNCKIVGEICYKRPNIRDAEEKRES